MPHVIHSWWTFPSKRSTSILSFGYALGGKIQATQPKENLQRPKVRSKKPRYPMQERDKSSGAAFNSCVWRKQVWSQYPCWAQQPKSQMCPGSWMAVGLPPVSPQGYCTFQHVLDLWLRSIGNFVSQNRWSYWFQASLRVQWCQGADSGNPISYIRVWPWFSLH